jgi:Nucleotidyl transferase AbiEii toxin, Type IV TA system
MGDERLSLVPRKPESISPFAEECLLGLSSRGLGTRLSIGGAVGLAYYFEYRPTHDVDAWWEEGSGRKDREEVVQCLKGTLARHGSVRTGSWGDVVSVELVENGRVVFSFPIAHRDARLDPPVSAPWPPNTFLDSFRDLVAAKMTTLVERGAPRDFRDIYAPCHAGVLNPETCWDLWKTRLRTSGSEPSASRARLAIQSHLGRIAVHRPLESVTDSEERAKAEYLRGWFRKEFLDALMD